MGAPLTAGRRFWALLLATAFEELLHRHVEVREDHEGERDVEAVAVLLHQEVPLELPNLVVVLLDGAHRVAGRRGERVKPYLPHACHFTAKHGNVDSKPPPA